MSSRALRRLQGNDDFLLLAKKSETSTASDSGYHSEKQSVVGETDRSHPPVAANVFVLLDNEDNVEAKDSSDNEELQRIDASKVKKKKKKKKVPAEHKAESIDDLLNSNVTPRAASTCESASVGSYGYEEILQVQHKLLNAAYEMKRRFGQKIVSTSESRKRDHKVYRKSSHLVSPANGWHPISKSAGLSMRLEGHQGEGQMFAFEHKPDYQKVQHQFWEAVDSLVPENLMAILNLHPYHIDSLLQLSEVCRMSEDLQMSAELIERALYAYESNFHPLFSLTTGKCYLDYKVWENRGFFLALFRNLHNIGNRGCYRTALEYCKLLLSLSTEEDPLCVLLLIDFYALRSDEYGFLVKLYELWNASRNLSALPNFAFSIPLALFKLSEQGSGSKEKANIMLQESLMRFPALLAPLLDACGVDADADKNVLKYFGSHLMYSQPASLKQLINLYVGRTFSCWKAPECMAWLESNVAFVSSLAQKDLSRYTELSDKGRVLYKSKTPINVARHLLLSEIKNCTVDLPLEYTNSGVLSYDPLPPADTVMSYSRPQRPARRVDNQGFLSAFFSSLMPNYNPEAPRDEVQLQGAANAQVRIREGVGNLMNAVRELLNSIEIAAPPREDEHDDDHPEEHDQDWE